MTTHPVSAIPYHEDRLSRLLSLLTAELHGAEPGTFVSRRTRHGPTVSLCVGEDSGRIVRIHSDDRPSGASAWDRWNAQVADMTQHLGIAHWRELPIDPEFRASRVYQEPTLVGPREGDR